MSSKELMHSYDKHFNVVWSKTTIYHFLNDFMAIDAGGKNSFDHKLASLMFLQSHMRDTRETNNNYSSFMFSASNRNQLLMLTWRSAGRVNRCQLLPY